MRSANGKTNRRNRRPAAAGAEAVAAPARSERYRQLTNPFEPLRIFSDDNVEALHLAALTILENLGIRVLHAGARRQLAAAGAAVDESTEMVRFDRGLVEQALSTVPHTVKLHGRSSDRTVTLGGRHVIITPVSGPPNVTDCQRGRRPGSLQEFRDFIRLAQSFDVIHALGPSVEPQDVPVNVRHLEMTHAQLTLSDKPPWVFCRGHQPVQDSFEMLRIVHGVDEAAFRERVYTYTVINTNSPRQLDIPMAEGIIEFAEARQLAIVTPFTLAGAMAPITVPGALTLAHAEALAGITLSQITRPGAPVAYGSFTSNVDMKSGSPAFGTPEYVKAALGAGQLARRIGVPWRSSSATASNAPDEQAVYEAEMSLWGALMGGCNVLLHGAGWLEGGLTASYEKFILDVEMLQMMAETFQPVEVSADEIGLDAIADVSPGGHFFSTPHTMQRYKTAFYSPLVSDWRNFGTWEEGGSRTARQRATDLWRSTLESYTAPAMDQAIGEELTAFVERRRAEGGAVPL
ncbi:MAG: trimethylamine methyltransferase [Betaproteobacteria bacterium]|nr:MAG: trimethylamine methyltransferase [Betaproteobacteria bacterium]